MDEAFVQEVVRALQSRGIGQEPSQALPSSQSVKQEAYGIRLMAYVRAFMTHGHLNADLDPLNLDEALSEGVASGKYKTPA